MHPLVPRARTAQQRARLILDVALGPLDIDNPAIASQTDRDQLEYSARAEAREILGSEAVRQWLADAENSNRADRLTAAAEQLSTVILTAARPQRPKGAPEDIARLHALLTLADRTMTAPIVTDEQSDPVIDEPIISPPIGRQ